MTRKEQMIPASTGICDKIGRERAYSGETPGKFEWFPVYTVQQLHDTLTAAGFSETKADQHLEMAWITVLAGK